MVVDRLAFDACVHREGETFTSFLADLRQLDLVQDGCAECQDVRLHTRIIVGICNETIRTNVLRRTPTPTLVELIQICLVEEAAQKEKEGPMLKTAALTAPGSMVAIFQVLWVSVRFSIGK